MDRRWTGLDRSLPDMADFILLGLKENLELSKISAPRRCSLAVGRCVQNERTDLE